MSQNYSHCIVTHSYSPKTDPSLFERHCHNEYELLHVLQGEGSYIVEGTQYPLRANTLMLFRPQEYHYVCPSETTPYDRYVIHFDGACPIDAAAQLPILSTQSVTSRGVYFSSQELMRRILPFFRMLDDLPSLSGGLGVAGEETAARTVITQVLMLLSPEHMSENEACSNELVSRVIDYLNAHLTEPLSLELLAQEFFISKYYLCRIFRKYIGMPIITYLNTKRIALAQNLLDEGVPAAETAERVGFQDYSAFYRSFRRQTGHAPAWRQTRQ